MRRLLLLAALTLPLLVPTTVRAGTCPALEGGVVDRNAYRIGEVMDFFGTYHDFADPGTVTITFERVTDGAIREYTAFNSPDGSWYLMHKLEDPADVGRWSVTVVVTQTDAIDTCSDTVTIRGAEAPNTAAEVDRTAASVQRDWPALVALAVLAILAVIATRSRLDRRVR